MDIFALATNLICAVLFFSGLIAGCARWHSIRKPRFFFFVGITCEILAYSVRATTVILFGSFETDRLDHGSLVFMPLMGGGLFIAYLSVLHRQYQRSISEATGGRFPKKALDAIDWANAIAYTIIVFANISAFTDELGVLVAHAITIPMLLVQLLVTFMLLAFAVQARSQSRASGFGSDKQSARIFKVLCVGLLLSIIRLFFRLAYAGVATHAESMGLLHGMDLVTSSSKTQIQHAVPFVDGIPMIVVMVAFLTVHRSSPEPEASDRNTVLGWNNNGQRQKAGDHIVVS